MKYKLFNLCVAIFIINGIYGMYKHDGSVYYNCILAILTNLTSIVCKIYDKLK